MLASLFFLGGEVIHGFAVVLLFGVFFGTYSSIFIASPVALMFGVCPADLVPVVKEGEHFDNLP